jgi:hypothetical protein
VQYVGIIFGAIICHEQVLFIAVDRWNRALLEFQSRYCPPKVYPIILCDVKIFECMAQAVIMVFVWTMVLL